MKKIILTLIVTLFLIPFCFAAISPDYKECMQRSYEIVGEQCIFPDGSECHIADFNDGSCGQEFMIEDYCVAEGKAVWDSDKCCKGSKSYLPPGYLGQPTCQPFSKRVLGNLQHNPFYWALIILVLLLIAGIIIYKMIKKHR